MKMSKKFWSEMGVLEAYEWGKYVGRMEAGNEEAEKERKKRLEEWMIEMGATKAAREADERWEKAHAEVVDGLDRVIGMLEEVPGKVVKAVVEEAEAGTEEVQRRMLGEREWVKDDDDGVEDEPMVISLPMDVAMELERRRQ